MSRLPVKLAHQLKLVPAAESWLIDALWSEQAVGIIGGEPKCCKSFLALDMAVSIASGTPCLRRFVPGRTGRVMLYAAEDALHVVRERLEGICRAAQVHLSDLDIQVITAPTLRLDTSADQQRLTQTVDELRPLLLLLDPFVRLHRIDENASSEVAPLLGYLRQLQRQFQLAVVLVHHARKGAHKLRPGQALRGSSEFHAWGDSNLYLRRKAEHLTLTIEHRAAASPADIPIALHGQAKQLALGIVDEPPQPEPTKLSATERLLHTLEQANSPLPFADLRKACRIRTERLCNAVNELKQQGRIQKTEHGYRLANL
ncbi:MAG: AAA family ATPase [bacterium]|nr:AAA family ATPase [bacterium]